MAEPKCRHCGAPADIHRYETQQCPVGGIEQSGDNYLSTVFEADERPAQELRIARLEQQVRELSSQVQVLRERVLGVPRVKNGRIV